MLKVFISLLFYVLLDCHSQFQRYIQKKTFKLDSHYTEIPFYTVSFKNNPFKP